MIDIKSKTSQVFMIDTPAAGELRTQWTQLNRSSKP